MTVRRVIPKISRSGWKAAGLLLGLALAANPASAQVLDFETDTPGQPPQNASFVLENPDERIDVEVVGGAEHPFPTGTQSLLLRNDFNGGTPLVGFAGDLPFPGVADGTLTLDFFPVRDEVTAPSPFFSVRLGNNDQTRAMGTSTIAIWVRMWRTAEGKEYLQIFQPDPTDGSKNIRRSLDITANFMNYNEVNSLQIDFASGEFQVFLNGQLLDFQGQSSFAMLQSITHINHLNLVNGTNAWTGSEVYFDNVVLPDSGMSQTPELTTVFAQDFTQDAEGFTSIRGGTIEQVASGTGGIESRSGGFHALAEGGEVTAEEPVPGGVRTFYDEKTGEWPGAIRLSVDVYVDVNMAFQGQAEGAGFEFTGTAYGPDGSWFRDYLFYVTAATEGGVSVSTGNGSSWTKTPGERTRRVTAHETILTDSGWYTFQHHYYEIDGQVYLDMLVDDAAGENVFSKTYSVSGTANIGNKNVGWFTFIDIDGGIAVDDVSRAVLNAPEEGYDVWTAQHFTETERQDSSISGPEADPAGDGVANLIKYALGLGDPKIPSRAGLPIEDVLTIDGQEYLTLTLTRPDGTDDVAYHVDASSDLINWPDAAVLVDALTQSNGDGTTTYTYRDVQPISAATSRFLSLRVVR